MKKSIITIILCGALFLGACTRTMSVSPQVVSAAAEDPLLQESTATLVPPTATSTTPPTPVPSTPTPGLTKVAAEDGTPQAEGTVVIPTATDLPMNMAATPSSEYANAEYLGQHTVQAGETVDSIGRAYGVDPQAIMKTNNLTSYAVAVGTVLNIPPVKWVNMAYGYTAVAQFPAMMPNTYFSK